MKKKKKTDSAKGKKKSTYPKSYVQIFNNLLLIIDEISKQKLTKDVGNLNNSIT